MPLGAKSLTRERYQTKAPKGTILVSGWYCKAMWILESYSTGGGIGPSTPSGKASSCWRTKFRKPSGSWDNAVVKSCWYVKHVMALGQNSIPSPLCKSKERVPWRTFRIADSARELCSGSLGTDGSGYKPKSRTAAKILGYLSEATIERFSLQKCLSAASIDTWVLSLAGYACMTPE